MCYFLVPDKKVTKEAGTGEALRTNAPSPVNPSRRNARTLCRLVTQQISSRKSGHFLLEQDLG